MARHRKYQPSNMMAPKSQFIRILNYILLVGFVILLITPIIIVFFASFKSNEEYMYTSFMQPPESFLNMENYKLVFTAGKMLTGFKNTLLLAVVAVVGSSVMGSMVAYVLGRMEFRGKRLIMNLFTVAIMIPSITTQVAVFTVIQSMGVYNTIFAGMILYIATDIVQIYILLQYTRSIPKELDESALIDGAGYFGIYSRIILPLMKPALFTAAILKFVGVYNDMFIPMIYMPKSSLRTVTTSIMSFSYDKSSQWNIMAAAILVVLVPVLIVYLFCQKYIISGVTDGAVKG